MVGGIIPDADVSPLEEGGVAKVFGPGSRVDEIVDYIQTNAPQR